MVIRSLASYFASERGRLISSSTLRVYSQAARLVERAAADNILSQSHILLQFIDIAATQLSTYLVRKVLQHEWLAVVDSGTAWRIDTIEFRTEQVASRWFKTPQWPIQFQQSWWIG